MVSGQVEHALNEAYFEQMTENMRALDGIVIGAHDDDGSESFQDYLRVAESMDSARDGAAPPCEEVEDVRAAELAMRRSDQRESAAAARGANPSRTEPTTSEPEPEPVPASLEPEPASLAPEPEPEPEPAPDR